jgi:uncharacterized membrane protein
MDWLNDISQTLSDPSMKHAMIVHWPIVLAGVGVILVSLVVITGARNRTLQWLALATFAALAIAGFIAMNSGEHAEHDIQGSLSAEASAVLEQHETLANWVWIFGVGLLVPSAMTFLRPRGAKLASGWIAAIASLFVMGWIANVAHFGGRLVYEFGVGAGGDQRAPSVPGIVSPPVAQGSDGEPMTSAELFFVNEVRPLLEAHCWKCHNAERRKGGLDQTSHAAMLSGGNSGPSIRVGKPEESLLITALKYERDELQMPPKQRLDDAQIAVFERWIADGAVWFDVTSIAPSVPATP